MKREIFMTGCCVVALAVQAKTLVWYRCETDGAVGESVSTLVNAANPGVFDGTAVRPTGSWKSTLTNSFSAVVLDQTNGVWSNAQALRMNPSGYNARWGNCFKIPAESGTETLNPESLTVKMFVNGTGNYICSMFGANKTKWSMWSDTSKLSASILRDDGTSKSLSYSYVDTLRKLTDGRWHHIALTYDASTREAKLYLDWELLGPSQGIGSSSTTSVTLATPMTNAVADVLIGGAISLSDPQATFGGTVDEVRISDVALAREKLLGYAESVNGDPADIIRLRLGATERPVGNVEHLVRDSRLMRCGYCHNRDVQTPGVSTNDVANAVVYQHGTRASGVANAASELTLCWAWNVSTWYWANGGVKVAADSFSAELFFKTKPEGQGTTSSRKDNYEKAVLLLDPNEYGAAWQIAFGTNGVLEATFDFADSQKVVLSTPKAVNDAVWHHVAVTYDKTTQKAEYWLDYKVVACATLPQAIEESDSIVYVGGKVPPSSGNYYSVTEAYAGFLDEVRISRGVLTKNGFLRGTLPSGLLFLVR